VGLARLGRERTLAREEISGAILEYPARRCRRDVRRHRVQHARDRCRSLVLGQVPPALLSRSGHFGLYLSKHF
jgi:hypothetical protein